MLVTRHVMKWVHRLRVIFFVALCEFVQMENMGALDEVKKDDCLKKAPRNKMTAVDERKENQEKENTECATVISIQPNAVELHGLVKRPWNIQEESGIFRPSVVEAKSKQEHVSTYPQI